MSSILLPELKDIEQIESPLYCGMVIRSGFHARELESKLIDSQRHLYEASVFFDPVSCEVLVGLIPPCAINSRSGRF